MALFSQGGGSSGVDDQATYFFWGFVALSVACIILWHTEKPLVVDFFFFLRRLEINLLLPLAKGMGYVGRYFFQDSFHPADALLHWKMYMNVQALTMIKWDDISLMSHQVGCYFRWVTISVSLAMAIYLFRFHRLSRYTRSYSMKQFRDFESHNWPQINPVLSTDLVQTPLDKGEWAMAKSPFQFCRHHQLLLLPSHQAGDDAWHVRSKEAENIFQLQMGSLLPNDLRQLPIYMQALLVIFVLKADRKMDEALDIIYMISRSAESGALDFTGVSALMNKYHDNSMIQWLRERHAYSYTFMAGALELSRTSGVVATAEFLWLKPLDRRLWYVLNSVGRQVCVIEAAGPFSHFLAEKRFKQALKVPMMKQAGVALETSISDILHVPEGDKWQRNAD